MDRFFKYYDDKQDVSPYITAAIAKFWFVTVHPFDDVNGRFSRIIAERTLAKAEKTNLRLYSLSTEIEKNKNAYYDILEKTQKGNLELTEWIVWFLNNVIQAAKSANYQIEKIQISTQFWNKHSDNKFNERQKKLIKRLLESNDFVQGISRKKYKNLVGTSVATSARDLKDLVVQNILQVEGEGRATKYWLKPES